MIQLYSFSRFIDGKEYSFSVPCESEDDARHLALRIDCETTGEPVDEIDDVCVNCLRSASRIEAPKYLFVMPQKLKVL